MNGTSRYVPYRTVMCYFWDFFSIFTSRNILRGNNVQPERQTDRHTHTHTHKDTRDTIAFIRRILLIVRDFKVPYRYYRWLELIFEFKKKIEGKIMRVHGDFFSILFDG